MSTIFSAATVRRRRNWNIILDDVKTRIITWISFGIRWGWQRVKSHSGSCHRRGENTKHSSWIYVSHAFFIDGNYEIYAGVRVTRDMLRWMIIKTHFARFGCAVVFMGAERLNFYFFLSLHTLRMIIIMIYSLAFSSVQEWIIFFSLTRHIQLFAVSEQKKVRNILRPIIRWKEKRSNRVGG